MLSPKQTAERLGVSPSLVYYWCGHRILAHHRTSQGKRGRILISESDIDAFLARNRVEAEVPHEVAGRTMPIQSSGFKNLDSKRLLEAWRRKGVLSRR